MHTPHMMMSISKSLPRNSGKNPEQVPQQEDGTGLQTPPQIELALASGWARKELWESLVHDARQLQDKTFAAIIHRAQEWTRTAAPHSGKSADGAPISK